MKKIFILLFLLPLLSFGATKTENRLVIEQSFRVDSSTTSLNTVFFQSPIISFDADTMAFSYEIALDSASKLSSPTTWAPVVAYNNITLRGDIQLLTPNGTGIRTWAFGTNIVAFTAKANSGALVAFPTTDVKALIPASAEFGKLWIELANPSSTRNFRGSIKIWLIKKYRGTF